MADRKISDLTALTAPASGDYLPIVDISEAAAASKNKRVTVQSLFQGIPVNVGIGTSSPDSTLHVLAGAVAGFRIGYNNTSVNYYDADTQIFRNIAGTERLRIDSSGNVGIGTSSPAHKLTVFAGNNANVSQLDSTAANGGYVIFSTSNTARGFIGAGGNTFASAAIGDFGIRSDSNLLFASGGSTERLRIDSSGNVGIGTSSPATLFHVTGAALIRGGNQTPSTNAPLPSETSPLSVLAFTEYLASPSTSINIGAANFDAVNNNNPFRYSITTPGGGGLNSFAVNSVEYNGSTYITKERLRIDSSGRVGIGTSAPQSLLHLGTSSGDIPIPTGNFATIRAGGYASASTAGIQLSGGYGDSGTTGAFNIKAIASGGGGFTATSALAITTTTAFGGVETERFRIDSSGNVGIGTSAPTAGYLLDCRGNVKFGSPSTAGIYLGVDANIPFVQGFDSGATYNQLKFLVGGSEAVRIDSSGRVGVGTSSPSEKLHVSGIIIGDANDNYFGSYSSGSAYLDIGNLGTSAAWIDARSTSLADVPLNIRSKGTGEIAFHGVSGEKVRIDSSGNVGIGTSSPRFNLSLGAVTGLSTSTPTTLDLGGSFSSTAGANPKLRVYWDGTDYYGFGASGGQLDYMVPAAAHVFYTNGLERLRIDSNGLVTAGSGGINGFQALLLNSGQIDTSGGLFTLRTVSNNTGGYYQAFRNANNNIIGTISQNGIISVAYNTNSDYRLKENVVPLTGAIDRLNDLQVHRFNFIADPDYTVDGFIAHEAADVVPECVTGEKDAIDDDGNPIYQGIDQSKLVPLLTAALQEAIARIETLEAAVAALQSA